ncbi:MAG: hypothetical protein V1495_05565 [Pseudomonadota bacterium]
MNTVSVKTYQITDLKRIYRVLHEHLLNHLDLMESEFFEDLQAYLHSIARISGIDISDHAAWERWLRDEPQPIVTRDRPNLRLVKN